MSDKFDLNRETNIANNIDAAGRKWVIHRNRGNGLCYIRPEPDREDAVIPNLMSGHWTQPSYLKDQLIVYLNRNWDESERIQRQSARSNEYAKEHPKAVFVEGLGPTPEQLIQAAVDEENAAIAKEKEDGQTSRGQEALPAEKAEA